MTAAICTALAILAARTALYLAEYLAWDSGQIMLAGLIAICISFSSVLSSRRPKPRPRPKPKPGGGY